MITLITITLIILEYFSFLRGPCLLLYIVKENCVPDFCEYLGPFSREEFISMPGTFVSLS